MYCLQSSSLTNSKPNTHTHMHYRNADGPCNFDRHLPGPDPSSPALQCRRSVKLPWPSIQLSQIDPEEWDTSDDDGRAGKHRSVYMSVSSWSKQESWVEDKTSASSACCHHVHFIKEEISGYWLKHFVDFKVKHRFDRRQGKVCVSSLWGKSASKTSEFISVTNRSWCWQIFHKNKFLKHSQKPFKPLLQGNQLVHYSPILYVQYVSNGCILLAKQGQMYYFWQSFWAFRSCMAGSLKDSIN